MKCDVPHCRSNSHHIRKGVKKVSFHRFPDDLTRQEIWKLLLGVNNITRLSRVCSLHFDPNDFERRRDKNQKWMTHLRSNAVPHVDYIEGNNKAIQDPLCTITGSSEKIEGEHVPSSDITDSNGANEVTQDPSFSTSEISHAIKEHYVPISDTEDSNKENGAVQDSLITFPGSSQIKEDQVLHTEITKHNVTDNMSQLISLLQSTKSQTFTDEQREINLLRLQMKELKGQKRILQSKLNRRNGTIKKLRTALKAAEKDHTEECTCDLARRHK